MGDPLTAGNVAAGRCFHRHFTGSQSDTQPGSTHFSRPKRGSGCPGGRLGAGVVAGPASADTIPDDDLAYARLLVAAELLARGFLRAGDRVEAARRGDALKYLKRALFNEQEHYRAVARDPRAAPGSRPRSAEDFDFSYPKGAFASKASIAKLGVTLETDVSSARTSARSAALQTNALKQPVARIAASEAEHLQRLRAALRRRSDRDLLPGAAHDRRGLERTRCVHELTRGERMPREFYSASEAARTLGISLDTLRRWDRQGRIKTTRDSSNRRIVTAKEIERLRGGAARRASDERAQPLQRDRPRREGRGPDGAGRDGRHRAGRPDRDRHRRLGRRSSGIKPGNHIVAVIKSTSVMVEH